MNARGKDEYILEYQPKYIKYRLLMRKRIVEILLVSSIYDSFIMEEDVRLSDQIYEEFHNLNLVFLSINCETECVGNEKKCG